MKHYNRDNFQLLQSVGFYITRARNLTGMDRDHRIEVPPHDLDVDDHRGRGEIIDVHVPAKGLEPPTRRT